MESIWRKQFNWKLIKEKQNETFNKNQIIDYFDNVLQITKGNNSLIEDAYSTIHEKLEFIDHQTDEYGGLFKIRKIIKKNLPKNKEDFLE